MEERGVDLVAVGYGANLHYLLAFDPHPTERPLLLLMTREREVLLVTRLHADDLDALDIEHRVLYTDADGPEGGMREAFDLLGLPGGRSGVAGGVGGVGVAAADPSMRADAFLLVQGALPGWRVGSAGPLLDALRLVKEPDELAALATVSRLTDRAVTRVWTQIVPGMSELDAAEVVRGAFHHEGADATAFCIVGFGPNSAAAHHQPDRRVLQAGDPILLDVGARLAGYHSDITRVGVAGEPTAEYLGIHRLVADALYAAIAAVRPGVRASDVDRAARDVISAGGFGPTFRHGVGHGIGLSVHESPYLTAGNDDRLEEGMAFTLEPGVYLRDRLGIRLEQVVTVTADGARVLNEAGLDIVRVPDA